MTKKLSFLLSVLLASTSLAVGPVSSGVPSKIVGSSTVDATNATVSISPGAGGSVNVATGITYLPAHLDFSTEVSPALSANGHAALAWDGTNFALSLNGGAYVNILGTTGTAAQTITLAPSANTAVAGLTLSDTTAATSGNQQYSPYLYFTSQGFKSAATAGSQSVTFRQGVVPVQGTANPTGLFTIESSVNGGAFGNALTLDTAGALVVNGGSITGGSSGLTVNAGGTNQNITLTPSGTGVISTAAGITSSNGVSIGSGTLATATGQVQIFNSSTVKATLFSSAAWFYKDYVIAFSDNAAANSGSRDTGLARNAAGVVEINNGTAGQFGALKCKLVPIVISTTGSINAKTVANTLLYTVPTGFTLVVTEFNVYATASSSITAGPSAGLGTASGTNDIAAIQTMSNVQSTTDTYEWPIVGASKKVAAAGTVYFNLTTGATGTSQTIQVDLIGYLY